MSASRDREPVVARYQPLSLRQRLLILMLAVATAIAVVLMLLERPGAAPRPSSGAAASAPFPSTAAPRPCVAGQSAQCVGGKVDVILPSPAASGRR